MAPHQDGHTEGRPAGEHCGEEGAEQEAHGSRRIGSEFSRQRAAGQARCPDGQSTPRGWPAGPGVTCMHNNTHYWTEAKIRANGGVYKSRSSSCVRACSNYLFSISVLASFARVGGGRSAFLVRYVVRPHATAQAAGWRRGSSLHGVACRMGRLQWCCAARFCQLLCTPHILQR